jgi:predicted nucleic acid-binding Zn ribbon protein
MRKDPPEICPVCGTEVPRNARACPECGACEKSGWSEDADRERLGLPSENFDYEEYIEREFGDKPQPTGNKKIWWFTAIALLVVIFVLAFAQFFASISGK